MKTRAEATAIANILLDEGLDSPVLSLICPEHAAKKGHQWHFGVLELRALMDYIYEGKPTNPSEYIHK